MTFALPPYVVPVFMASVGYTVWCFWRAIQPALPTMRARIIAATVIISWIAFQGALARSGFYLDTYAMPPHLMVALVPPILTIFITLLLPAGRRGLAKVNLHALTWLNVVRIPVELVLWWLFLEGYVPQLMTFEGGNLDILTGIAAIAAALWGFSATGEIQRRGLLWAWNIGGLALLLNIVIRAILSLPSPLQQLAFEQPNIAVIYVPFVWLPSVIVMAAFFTHIVSLWRLRQ